MAWIGRRREGKEAGVGSGSWVEIPGSAMGLVGILLGRVTAWGPTREGALSGIVGSETTLKVEWARDGMIKASVAKMRFFLITRIV